MKIFEADIKKLLRKKENSADLHYEEFALQGNEAKAEDIAEKQAGALSLKELSEALEYENRRYNKRLTL